jgi:hypothetical protein
MRIALLIIFALFSFSLPCFSQTNTDLVVISEKGKKFILYINDEKINPEPQANVKVIGISEGSQKIRIEFEGSKNSLIDSVRIKPLEKNQNKEFTYAIREVSKNGSVRTELVFVSSGERSGPAVPVVPEVPVYVVVKDNNLYGNLYQAKDNKPIFFRNYNEETRTCSVKLDDKEVQYALDLVKKSNDLEDKFKYIETAILQNCYTTSQLAQLINVLDSEMDKLKLAKAAYSHLSDPSNAYKLAEIMKFKGFKDDYLNFLKEQSNVKQQVGMKCTVPIGELEFDAIYTSVKKTPYEYDKLKKAKKESVNHCMSTDQVKRMLTVFSHDREKLEFTKSVYPVVTDKSNFSILEESFQFNETKQDFIKFLSK